MAQTATIKIQLRRGTLAQWQTANPVLLHGEIGLVHDGTYPVGFVIGNGTNTFTDLWASNAFKFTPESTWQLALNAINTTLSNAISAEANTRGAADIALNNAILTEAQTRINADASLSGQIGDEETARITADTALSNQIAAVDSSLAGQIAGLEANILNWYGLATNPGDILAYDPTVGNFLILSPGTAGQILSADPTEDLGLKWIPAPTGTGDMTKAEYDTDLDGVVDAAEREQIEVLNKTGATVTKGTIVYLKTSSSSAAHPEILKADATTEATSSKTIGAVYQDIAEGDTGYIVTSGQVHNLNTSAYSVGTKLWLATTPGQVTTTPPTQPAHSVFIGTVTRSQVNNGGILYAIQNGYEINELHDVLITSPTADQVLYRDTDGLWKNATIAGILGYTPANEDSLTNYELVITPGTTSQYWRGDKSWQTLDKSAVGLGNVDNTSDTNKPVSSATQTALNAKENTITAGTTGQYWRGDKSWQTLDKSAVGLANVDNTSDANKPISTATQTALNAKENTIAAGTTGQYWRGDKSWQTLDKTAVGLGNVDNTTDANKPISTATQTALNGKESTIAAGTTGQYWRGDKSWQTLDKAAVGLANVDNTNDANKPISTATQTALNAKQNTLNLTTTGTSGPATLSGSTLNIPQYSGGGGGGITAGESIAYAIALG